jgi:hypothetical protein
MAQAAATKGLERISDITVDDISHAAVGTSSTAPAVSDTQLGTETDRVATTKRIKQGATFQARINFSNANLPTTVGEVGWFMNGSGTANSGELLVRATLTFAKGTQDLLVIIQGEIKED